MPTLLDVDAGRIVTVATFYQASQLLGCGRYSEVYKAFDIHHQTDVALKVYTGVDSKTHELAKNEASLLERLATLNSEFFPGLRQSAKCRIRNEYHPLLVLELGAYTGDDGQKCVMSLKDVIPQIDGGSPTLQPNADFWEVRSLIRWIIDMVQAVQQLHSIGLVHRDIKPANVLLKRGAGQTRAVPFLLDFNSACGAASPGPGTGTPRYLPPEVTSGKRQAPQPEDDLWAVAVLSWEMVFGQSAAPEHRGKPHELITGTVPEAFLGILSRALSLVPEERFSNAAEMLAALEAVAPVEVDKHLAVRSDEMAAARKAMDRIRQTISAVLAPPGQIFVSKDVNDAVTTVFAWLSQEDSQALDLIHEIVSLGPSALPACLKQGYRLQHRHSCYEDVVTALSSLAASDMELAKRSINAYAVSSNRGVRALCWRLSERLRYCPGAVVDKLTSDDGLLSDEERLALSDLCIRFPPDGDKSAHEVLKYMCREYIVDKSRYIFLRDNVARRLKDLYGSQAAKTFWDGCLGAVWSEVKDFRALQGNRAQDVEGGLLELMADAFAATGESALEVLTAKRKKVNAGGTAGTVFYKFAVKSGAQTPAVHNWLMAEAAKNPGDGLLHAILRKLQPEDEKAESPALLLERYFTADDKRAYNKLRFWKTNEVLELVNRRLCITRSQRDLDLILKLLKGYQNRRHRRLVDIVLANWAKLSGHDFKSAVDLLVEYPIGTEQQEAGAIAILDSGLGGPHDVEARRGLEQILEHKDKWRRN